MAYYAMWRQDNHRAATTEYDCDYCMTHGLNKQRICFKYDYDPVEDFVPILAPPSKEELGDRIISQDKWPVKKLNAEGILEALVEFEQQHSVHIPAFDALVSMKIAGLKPDKTKAEICHVGLWDDMLWRVIEIESACSEYHSLPDPGSLSEQHPWVVNMFFQIMTAKAQYRSIKLQKQKDQFSNYGNS